MNRRIFMTTLRLAMRGGSAELPRFAFAAHRERAAVGDLHVMKRAMIEEALHEARFNKSGAAVAVGLTRTQLYV